VEEERELTVKEVAKELRLSKRMIFYRIRRSDIKARKVGWQWLVKESEVAEVKTLEWYRNSRLMPTK
jgi:excisionase family DNA binding protein